MDQPSPLAAPLPWNLVATAYADEIVPKFEAYARDALRLAAAPAGSRVVDVACGPGTLSVLAARGGLAVDAIDFSPAMIERLETRLAASEIEGVTPRVGDGQALPYPDASFAAGFSMFGLMFFPDRAKGFAELRRVLRPGARAVVASWIPLDTVPVMAAVFGALGEAVAATGAPAGPKEMPLSRAEACLSEMSAAFDQVEVRQVTHAEGYPSGEALWQSLQRTMAPLVLMRQNLGEARWAPIGESARAAVLRAAGPGPVEVSFTAFLSVGVA
jgi:SAM-dependent methyltransferase